MIVGLFFCEEKKRREQELLRTKRRRLPDTLEGGAAEEVERRSKRRKLPLMSENWEEDHGGEHKITSIVMEQDYTMAPTCPPVTGRRGRGTKRLRLPSNTLSSSLMTDHFCK